MFDFERAVVEDQGIPIKEAADFYLGLKKTAQPDPLEAASERMVSSLEKIAIEEPNTDVHHPKSMSLGGATALGGAAGAAEGISLPWLAADAKSIHAYRKAHPEATLGQAFNRSPAPVISGARRAVHTGIGALAGAGLGAGLYYAKKHKDEKATKEASIDPLAIARMRMKVAYLKLAANEPGEEAQMTAPTDTQQMQPQNYLMAEQVGRQAQEATESAYYRERAQEAQQMATQAQQQMSDLQMQLQGLQSQADTASQAIQQSQQSALAAQDEALKQTQVAGNMRMGIQKLRAQMMEVASQDPAEVAAQELQAQAAGQQAGAVGPDGQPVAGPEGPGAGDGQAPPEGPAGSASGAEAAPGTAPPGGAIGAGTPQAPVAEPAGVDTKSTASPNSDLKVAGVLDVAKAQLPWALGGAAVLAGVGAHHAYQQGQHLPEAQARVRELEQGQEQGGFMQAMKLVAAKHALIEAEASNANPRRAMISGALSGAGMGAVAGPAVGQNIMGAIHP